MNMKILLISLNIVLILCSNVMAQVNTNMQNIQPKVISLAQDLTNGVVVRVEILNFPEHIYTRAAVKPEWLDRNYRYKLEIRESPGSKKIESLHQLLLIMHPDTPVIYYDMRWAFICYDAEGKKRHSIYYDTVKKGGILDGESIGFDGGYASWLGTNFNLVFEQSRDLSKSPRIIADENTPVLCCWFVEDDGSGRHGYTAIDGRLGDQTPLGGGLFAGINELRDALVWQHVRNVNIVPNFGGVIPQGFKIRSLTSDELQVLYSPRNE